MSTFWMNLALFNNFPFTHDRFLHQYNKYYIHSSFPLMTFLRWNKFLKLTLTNISHTFEQSFFLPDCPVNSSVGGGGELVSCRLHFFCGFWDWDLGFLWCSDIEILEGGSVDSVLCCCFECLFCRNVSGMSFVQSRFIN